MNSQNDFPDFDVDYTDRSIIVEIRHENKVYEGYYNFKLFRWICDQLPDNADFVWNEKPAS